MRPAAAGVGRGGEDAAVGAVADGGRRRLAAQLQRAADERARRVRAEPAGVLVHGDGQAVLRG